MISKFLRTFTLPIIQIKGYIRSLNCKQYKFTPKLQLKKRNESTYKAESVVVVIKMVKLGLNRRQCLITGIAAIPSPNIQTNKVESH